MDMKALNFLTTRDAGWAREKLRVFLLLWFVLSYVQGVFSGLNEDEPYYYMYAMFPAWGYFDHPPMVGVFAWAGMQMFGKVLGTAAVFGHLLDTVPVRCLETDRAQGKIQVRQCFYPDGALYPDGERVRLYDRARRAAFVLRILVPAGLPLVPQERKCPQGDPGGHPGGGGVVQQVSRSAGAAAGGGLQCETAARPLFLHRGSYGAGAVGAPYHLAGGARFSLAVLSFVRTYGR